MTPGSSLEASMVVVWIVLGAVLLVGLGIAGLYDRRARARGSQLRSGADMEAVERDARRSIRGGRFGATPDMNTWRPPDERR